MASKRKSTIPCLIPSKTKHVREEIILGCLPELLPTIPEDSILSISGEEEEASRCFRDFSKHEGHTTWQDWGAYSCQPCRFESRELNLFLDHVDRCHTDFRTQPNFCCSSCGISAVGFQALALHNAKAHPELGTGGSLASASLRVGKRDGVTTVEQSLFTGGGDEFGEVGIFITKTPIMKMMRAKGEHKKIVVSHAVEVQRVDPGSNKGVETRDRAKLAHVPVAAVNGDAGRTLPPPAVQIVSGAGAGALPMLRLPSTHGMTTMQRRGARQQAAPITVNPTYTNPSSSSSSDFIKNLPKVMIPLSSIPTYDAAMDKSSFLNTSFGKFPYPTKAELCYLTVVSDFPEEQIKLWFTAQRLKQGISWSPEEIEEARRKMFNTIFQAAPAPSQKPHHYIPQHSVSAQSASASSSCRVPQGSMAGWQTGVIIAQPGTTQAVAPNHQAVVRTASFQARPIVTTLEADNGVCVLLGAAGSVTSGCRSSISRSSNIITHTSVNSHVGHSSAKTADNGIGRISYSNINASCSTRINSIKNGNSDDDDGKLNNRTSNSCVNGSISNLTRIDGTVGRNDTIHNSKSTSCSTQSNDGISSQIKSPGVANENVSNNNASKSNNGSISISTSTSHSSTSSNYEGNILDHTSKTNARKTITGTPPVPSSSNSSSSEMEELLPNISQSSCSLPASPLDASLCKSQKSQEKSPGALKQSFVHWQFPDQGEVERLMKATGLSVREVCKWFSDGRHHDSSGSPSATGDSLEMSAISVRSSPLPSPDISDYPSLSVEGVNPCQASQSPSRSSPPPPQKQQSSPPTTLRKAPCAPSSDATAVCCEECDPLQLLALEESFSQDTQPSEAEVERLRVETKMTHWEIDSWFSERRKRNTNKKCHGRVALPMPSSIEEELKHNKEALAQETSTLQRYVQEEDQWEGDSSCPEPKVGPIKINLKMLKVTEPDAKPGLQVIPPELESEISKTLTSPTSLSISLSKKTPEQVHLLRQAFANTPWPNSQQLDKLIVMTGLPQAEVASWFGDCRHIHKNGHLKWLERYQHIPPEAKQQFAEDDNDYKKGNTETQWIDDQTKSMEQELAKGLVETDWLGSEQQKVLQDSQTHMLLPLKTKELERMEEIGAAFEATAAGMPQDHWVVKGQELKQPIDSPGLREHQAQDNQSRDRLRGELLKV